MLKDSKKPETQVISRVEMVVQAKKTINRSCSTKHLYLL